MGRPKGSYAYDQQDRELVERMRILLADGRATTETEAARAVASDAAGPITAAASKVKRLVRKYRIFVREKPVFVRGQQEAKSASTGGVSIESATRFDMPEAASVIADLEAELSARRVLCARYEEAIDQLIDALERRLPKVEARQHAIEDQQAAVAGDDAVPDVLH